MKRNFLILGALIFGFLAAFFTWSIIEQEQTRYESSMIDVTTLKAVRTITAGERINREDIIAQKERRPRNNPMTQGEVPVGSLLQLVGKEVAFTIQQGAIIRWNDIAVDVKLGSGFSRIIDRDYRAVTLAMGSAETVNNLIRPGDRVDIVGSFKRPDMKGDEQLEFVTLTIMQNVTVLATGSEYGQNVGRAPGSQRSYSSVTVQVTPSEAEVLIFAAKRGDLTCTLRPPTDSNTMRGEFNNVNWDFFLNNIQNYAKQREKRPGSR